MQQDEQAIQNILSRMEEGWNRSDSASIAALFAEDATLIQIFGGQLDGRTAIEGSHRAIFDTIYKGSRAAFKLRGIRFVRPDVAIAFSYACVSFPGDSQRAAVETRPTLVVVKEDGRWQIVTFHNTRISAMPAAAHEAARLAS